MESSSYPRDRMLPPFSQRVEGLQSSAIREILRVVNRADIISFAGGLPAPELFPLEELSAAVESTLGGSKGRQALQYAETDGHPGLREEIVRRLPYRTTKWTPGNILVTQGSQQGLDLLAKLFLDPGDEVLVETPAYLGALQVFRFFRAKVTFLPSDEQGILPDALREALARRPKLLYLTPTFQNPSGICYPEKRREEIRAVLQDAPVLVIEDDPYRELWYDAPPPLPLTDGLGMENVVYLGSFSKTAAPGLRVGYLVGSPEIVKRSIQVKQATDLQTNTLGQHVLDALLRSEAFDRHLDRLRSEYRLRRDALDSALRERLGEALAWNRPEGGMFLWTRLSRGGAAADLLPLALAEGLAFVSGAEFHAKGEGQDTIRLNFTHAAPDTLREGVRRLAAAVDRFGVAK